MITTSGTLFSIKCFLFLLKKKKNGIQASYNQRIHLRFFLFSFFNSIRVTYSHCIYFGFFFSRYDQWNPASTNWSLQLARMSCTEDHPSLKPDRVSHHCLSAWWNNPLSRWDLYNISLTLFGFASYFWWRLISSNKRWNTSRSGQFLDMEIKAALVIN